MKLWLSLKLCEYLCCYLDVKVWLSWAAQAWLSFHLLMRLVFLYLDRDHHNCCSPLACTFRVLARIFRPFLISTTQPSVAGTTAKPVCSGIRGTRNHPPFQRSSLTASSVFWQMISLAVSTAGNLWVEKSLFKSYLSFFPPVKDQL